MASPAAARRDAAGRRALAAFAVAAVALGLTLLAPRLFSDPVAVDPYSVRLAATGCLLLGASFLLRGLRDGRAVLLAVAAVVAPFCLWSAAPDALILLFGDRVDGLAAELWASVAQVLLTLGFIVLARAVLDPAHRPDVRLRRFDLGAAGASAAGIVLFVLVILALPATLLGRVALTPVALGRDLPLLGPAGALQGAAQELQFRGILMGSLERVAPPWLANAGQAAMFGLAHIAVQYEGPAGPFIPVAVVLGLVLGWVTQRTRSLWPAIAIHAVADVLVTVGVVPGLYGS